MNGDEVNVVRINMTAVKGTRIEEVPEVSLGCDGVYENRRFYFIDARGAMVNGKRTGELTRIRSAFDRVENKLTMVLPDGAVIAGLPSESGETVTTNFYGRPVVGAVVEGEWAAAVSTLVGHELRLVRVADGTTGTDVHPVTLISRASMERTRNQANGPISLWEDRFRMLFEVDGLQPFGEDMWIGARLTMGDALIEIVGPIPRCVVTKRDPVSGVPDFDTLGALRRTRGENLRALGTPTEHLPDGGKLLLGVYGVVRKGGRVREHSRVTSF